MLKKLIVTIVFLLFVIAPSMAENVVVESLSEFSKDETETNFSAKILEKAEFENGLIFEENSIIKGKVLKTVDAKRGKRDAYIIIRPVSYVSPDNNTIKNIEEEYFEAKVVGYSKKDFKETALNAGLAVGGYFVKGLGQIFYFSKGLIIPDKDKSRVSTAMHNVYENTPFKYIEKGAEIDIDEGDKLVLKFYRTNVPKWRILKRQK